jgi:hypothetical protein
MSAAGDPVTQYTPDGSGRQNVFYRDDQGNIWHVFYDMGTSSRVTDPNPWATHAGVSNLAAMFTPNGQLHIFYLQDVPSTNVGIYQVFEELSAGGPVLGPEEWVATEQLTFALDPATMYTPNGQQHLFCVATAPDGLGIYHVFYDPSNPANPSRPSSQGGTPELWVSGAPNKPATMYTPEGNGQEHIFYRNDGGIYHVFYDPNNPGNPHGPAFAGGSPEQWVSGGSGPSAAAGDPATMYTPNGQQHVFYRGNSNEIYHVFYDMSTQTQHFDPPESWAPGAAGNPGTLYTPNGQQHVFYRSSNGNLYQVFYDMNSRTLYPPELWVLGYDGVSEPYGVAGDPATMYTPNGQQHVFYRGNDNGIHHVFYDPNNPNNPYRPSAQGGGVPERWV